MTQEHVTRTVDITFYPEGAEKYTKTFTLRPVTCRARAEISKTRVDPESRMKFLLDLEEQKRILNIALCDVQDIDFSIADGEEVIALVVDFIDQSTKKIQDATS